MLSAFGRSHPIDKNGMIWEGKKRTSNGMLSAFGRSHPIDNKEQTYLSTTIRMDRQKNKEKVGIPSFVI